jgi:hypothetical protein
LEVGEVKRQLYKCLSAIETQEPEHPLVEAITPVGSNTSPILIAFISGLESIGGLDWDDDNNPIPVISDGERENLSSLISNIEARMRLVLPAYTLPSFYIPLRQVPLAISGKADRKRLRSIVSQLSIKQLATSFSTAT